MTPIFDQLAAEVGFVPAPAAGPENPGAYNLDQLINLKRDMEQARFTQYRRRFVIGHDVPRPTVAEWLHNMRISRNFVRQNDSPSLQEFLPDTLCYTVERYLPSEEKNSVTTAEFPHGQETGKIEPVSADDIAVEPEERGDTNQGIYNRLMANLPGWHGGAEGPDRSDFQHDDGRGIRVWWDENGDLARTSFFYLGQPTQVAFDEIGYSELNRLVDTDIYWVEIQKRRLADDEETAADAAQTQRDLLQAEQDKIETLRGAADERQVQVDRVNEVIVHGGGGGRHHAHPEPVDDGKYRNPGAAIAEHQARVETADARAQVIGDQPEPTLPRPVLPPEVHEKIAASLHGLQDKVVSALSTVAGQPFVPYADTPAQDRSAEQQILDDAEHTICWDRTDDYGVAEDSFATIAQMWESYLNARPGEVFSIDARDVAQMMVLMKVARDAHGRKRDNLVDQAGYSALAERAVRSER